MAGPEEARRRPALPWTVRAQLAALSLAHRRDGSVRRLLFSLGDHRSAANPSRPDASGVRSADVVVDAATGVWARVFSPSPPPPSAEDAPPLSVVVYFHGGGFALFSPASRPYDAFCRRLCRALGAAVVSVAYRLAPAHRFPAPYDDGLAVLRFLATSAAQIPVPLDLSRCFLAGDSAGGNIAHHVAHRWSSSSSSASSLNLAGVVLIQPFFGGEERTEAELELDKAIPSLSMAITDAYWRDFLPEGATRDHAAAACGVGELAEAFPPAMVAVGGFDLLKGWQARYVEKLRGMGKPVKVMEYPDAIHGFHVFPEIADSGKFLEDLKVFVQEHRAAKL
ncbi:probable carboxylesterase 18 [Brachypodium distachyon]|uniref:Alpha/beta hydrolase fold-3 domain-containing protein n=1 Tax=Brachypodium distachyon TaxID=15368 RepID=I1GRT4_BRADI|nr:probable carboxylesterase 18 [Brachypodium distachyon]KQK14956.1 hypothetical protein BRADI_1g19760v3 [Brachypodium distachyon]|eukprot:XP_003562573.1 probable carboxylesterase 18 [Brachypodium distachyon]